MFLKTAVADNIILMKQKVHFHDIYFLTQFSKFLSNDYLSYILNRCFYHFCQAYFEESMKVSVHGNINTF